MLQAGPRARALSLLDRLHARARVEPQNVDDERKERESAARGDDDLTHAVEARATSTRQRRPSARPAWLAGRPDERADKRASERASDDVDDNDRAIV